MKKRKLTTSIVMLPNRSPVLMDDDEFVFKWLINDFFNDAFREESPSQQTWCPPVNIWETDESINFVFELPGISKKDIKLFIENKVLTLSGVKHNPIPEGCEYYTTEIFTGSFSREFSIPENIDLYKAKAKFYNGLLLLNFPFKEKAPKIPIEITDETNELIQGELKA
jgi:HSP20 family protein